MVAHVASILESKKNLDIIYLYIAYISSYIYEQRCIKPADAYRRYLFHIYAHTYNECVLVSVALLLSLLFARLFPTNRSDLMQWHTAAARPQRKKLIRSRVNKNWKNIKKSFQLPKLLNFFMLLPAFICATNLCWVRRHIKSLWQHCCARVFCFTLCSFDFHSFYTSASVRLMTPEPTSMAMSTTTSSCRTGVLV